MMRTLLLVIFVAGAVVAAQEPRPAVVRAMGEASVSVRADRASVCLGVVSSARSSERAGERNAERTTELIARLRAVLGKDADIRTLDYALNKDRLEGYVARNTIEVHVHDPALTSKVIDLAAGLDVIVVRAVPSAAPDDPIARSEALKVATAQARVNAEAMAAALGLRVVRILSAETVAAPALANHEMARKRVSAALPTPVEAGTLEISSQVVVTLEVAP